MLLDFLGTSESCHFSPWLPSALCLIFWLWGWLWDLHKYLWFFTFFLKGPHKILVLKTIRFLSRWWLPTALWDLGKCQTDLFLTVDQTHEEWLFLPSSKFTGSMNLSRALTTCLFSPGPHRLPFERKLVTLSLKIGEYVIILPLSPTLCSPLCPRVFFVVSSALSIWISPFPAAHGFLVHHLTQTASVFNFLMVKNVKFF